jgi:hypothetical protein
VRDARARALEADVAHRVAELLAVLGHVDGLARGAISSTPNFSSTPSRTRSSAQLSAVCPPIVGSSASGRSFSMMRATVRQLTGSM